MKNKYRDAVEKAAAREQARRKAKIESRMRRSEMEQDDDAHGDLEQEGGGSEE